MNCNYSPHMCDLGAALIKQISVNAVISIPLSSSECQLDISYHAVKFQGILADTHPTVLSGRYSVN